MREPSRSSNCATRRVDIAGDEADPGLDALMDVLEARRDGVGQMRAAAVDGVGDRSDALIDGLDRLRRASVSDEARWVSRESIAGSLGRHHR